MADENVLVLMSSYNGEKYIRQQIESILNQKNVNVYLLVRDDGSNDDTVDLVRNYKEKNVLLYEGKNLGAAQSFMDLLYRAKTMYPQIEYFALADQDDIWLPEKLSRGIKHLKQEKADLYCGSLDAFVNENLNSHYIYECKLYDKFEQMLRNTVAGCTMVMNRKMLFRICEYRPTYIEMHDSWILRVCIYSGMKVILDTVPQMRYRLHGNNTCGAAITLRKKIYIHFRNVFFRNENNVSNTADELLSGYSNYLSQEDLMLLTLLSKKTAPRNRKKMLIEMCMKKHFSTVSRKIDFILEVLLKKI